MIRQSRAFGLLAAFVLGAVAPQAGATGEQNGNDRDGRHGGKRADEPVKLGSRPHYLVAGMQEGPLKERLMRCKDGRFEKSDFSIGHRGAALQFPKHTQESYTAAAQQGAGIVECDVTFTRDGEFVCRHAENDLHTTTNILAATNMKKTRPFASL